MLDGDPPMTRLMIFDTPPGLMKAAVFPGPTENWLKLWNRFGPFPGCVPPVMFTVLPDEVTEVPSPPVPNAPGVGTMFVACPQQSPACASQSAHSAPRLRTSACRTVEVLLISSLLVRKGSRRPSLTLLHK